MRGIRIEVTYNNWRPVRSIYFHRCADSNKIIWPFTEAYYSDCVNTDVRAQLRLHSVPTWISDKAFMLRKLKGDV